MALAANDYLCCSKKHLIFKWYQVISPVLLNLVMRLVPLLLVVGLAAVQAKNVYPVPDPYRWDESFTVEVISQFQQSQNHPLKIFETLMMLNVEVANVL